MQCRMIRLSIMLANWRKAICDLLASSSGTLASNLLIVSGAISTAGRARSPKFMGTEIGDKHFSEEEKELTSESRFKGSGSLRMRKYSFATKGQGLVKSFKSSFLHCIAY